MTLELLHFGISFVIIFDKKISLSCVRTLVRETKESTGKDTNVWRYSDVFFVIKF